MTVARKRSATPTALEAAVRVQGELDELEVNIAGLKATIDEAYLDLVVTEENTLKVGTPGFKARQMLPKLEERRESLLRAVPALAERVELEKRDALAADLERLTAEAEGLPQVVADASREAADVLAQLVPLFERIRTAFERSEAIAGEVHGGLLAENEQRSPDVAARWRSSQRVDPGKVAQTFQGFVEISLGRMIAGLPVPVPEPVPDHVPAPPTPEQVEKIERDFARQKPVHDRASAVLLKRPWPPVDLSVQPSVQSDAGVEHDVESLALEAEGRRTFDELKRIGAV